MIGSRRPRGFETELLPLSTGSNFNICDNDYAEWDMDDVNKFRQYAAECRRLAQRASDNDRKVLMEIAEAWIACAEEAERKEKARISKLRLLARLFRFRADARSAGLRKFRCVAADWLFA
jgi:hypothetical protein